jgi:putative two-component system response regulator
MKTFAGTIPIVYHHHERLDGSGYPDGIAGEAIPLLARITTIADVFDALSAPRVYRRALRREESLRVMADEVRKGWWDPRLFDEFLGVLAARSESGDNPLSAAASAARDELAWVL